VFGQVQARIITLPADATLNDVQQAVTSACSGAHATVPAEAAAPDAIAAAAAEAAAASSNSAADPLLDALTLAADELKMRCYTGSVSTGIIDGNNVVCLCTSLSSTARTIADTSAGASSVAVQSKRKRKDIEQELFELKGQLRVLARCTVRLHVIDSSNNINSSSNNINSSSSKRSRKSAAHVIRLIQDAAETLQVSSDASAELIHARLSQPIAALAAVSVAAAAAAVAAAPAAPEATVTAAAATTAEAEAAAVTAAVTVAATSSSTSSAAASTTAERHVTSVEAVAATQAESAVTCVEAAETAVAATAAAAAVAAATATECAAIRVEAAEVVVLSDSDNADSDDDVMIVDMAPTAKKAVTKAVVKAATTVKPSTISTINSSSSSSGSIMTPSSNRQRARANITPLTSSCSRYTTSSINCVSSSSSGRPVVKSKVATVSRFVSKQAALVVSSVHSLVEADYALLIAENPDDAQQRTNSSSDSDSGDMSAVRALQQHSSSVYCNCTEAQQKLIRKTLKVRALKLCAIYLTVRASVCTVQQ
jgi:hypothetical protein